MAPIIELSQDTLETLNPSKYTRRMDLEGQVVQIADLDTRDWVVIPYEFTNGKRQSRVDPARLSYSPALEIIGKKLDLNLGNTSKDSLGREFIGNVSWEESLMINLALGNTTPDMEAFVDYGRLLFLGMQGKIKVYNAAGKQIDEETLRNYFEDIYKIKNSWRAEWIDSYFEKRIDGAYTLTQNKTKTEKLDKDTLMEDKQIDLESWLNNHTTQRLPTKNVKSGNLYYWHPRENSVARFGAYSSRTSLNCDSDPSGRNSNLGVRAVRHE